MSVGFALAEVIVGLEVSEGPGASLADGVDAAVGGGTAPATPAVGASTTGHPSTARVEIAGWLASGSTSAAGTQTVRPESRGSRTPSTVASSLRAIASTRVPTASDATVGPPGQFATSTLEVIPATAPEELTLVDGCPTRPETPTAVPTIPTATTPPAHGSTVNRTEDATLVPWQRRCRPRNR